MQLIKDYNHWLVIANVNTESKENVDAICFALENLTSSSNYVVTRNSAGTIFLRVADSETLLYFKQQEEITEFLSYLKMTNGESRSDN